MSGHSRHTYDQHGRDGGLERAVDTHPGEPFDAPLPGALCDNLALGRQGADAPARPPGRHDGRRGVHEHQARDLCAHLPPLRVRLRERLHRPLQAHRAALLAQAAVVGRLGSLPATGHGADTPGRRLDTGLPGEHPLASQPHLCRDCGHGRQHQGHAAVAPQRRLRLGKEPDAVVRGGRLAGPGLQLPLPPRPVEAKQRAGRAAARGHPVLRRRWWGGHGAGAC
mmetsp:Transcript_62430/g.125102  ORF Transcript_62430/g.125102 Transcript_62430/m.125102 type:complete len:224 (+) Transcript_62430:378-1049(+)